MFCGREKCAFCANVVLVHDIIYKKDTIVYFRINDAIDQTFKYETPPRSNFDFSVSYEESWFSDGVFSFSAHLMVTRFHGRRSIIDCTIHAWENWSESRNFLNNCHTTEYMYTFDWPRSGIFFAKNIWIETQFEFIAAKLFVYLLKNIR